MGMDYDLVIRGGMIADGRGSPLFEADLGVSDGRIAAMGKFGGSGGEEIDARGLLVAPGFVDIHSHYDGQAVWDERLLPSGWHGVTTTVMGNCGVGFAPVRDGDRDRLVDIMEGVEDIPGKVLHEGLSWDWTSFPDFLDALESRPRDIDVCAQLPHSAVRIYVMGDRAARLEPATPDDIAQMRRIACEAMHAGAIGFSTSRTLNHRMPNGDPIPSQGARGDELSGIAMGLKDAGRGVLQIISDFFPDQRAAEFGLMRDMVQASGRPLSLTMLQRNHDPEGWRDVMGMVEAAAEDGLPIRVQVAPRPLGTLYGLDMARHPFSFHPSFQAIADLPLSQKVAALRDPGMRARLVAERPVHAIERLVRRVESFDHMFPLGDPPDYAPPRENSITAIAKREGRTRQEVAYDLMLEDDGRAMLFAPGTNYAYYNLDVCREFIEHPQALVSLGDGGAHVAHISDVSFSTYLLTHWGRDSGKNRLDVSWLVKRMTGDTAHAVGLHDRGVLAPGFKADINIIDLDRLRIDPPYMVHDLPLGSKRLLQRAHGYVATIVSGMTIYREGEATAELPGRLVRGPQRASAD
jgi:N-acyl-D-aspartate/D-glutamate deacylase